MKWFRRSDIIGVLVAYAVILCGVYYVVHVAPAQEAAALKRAIESQATQPQTLTAPAHDVKQGLPKRLAIKRLGIDLPVVATTYNTQNHTWPVFDRAANYASNTYAANDSHGVTFIYGHNNTATLGKTTAIRAGDELVLETSANHVFTYVYISDEVVGPVDTTALTNLESQKPLVKLMTCTGVFSQDRRIMLFELKAVQ
ncbi:sortase [Patescibacteria group bacterium]|nr:MAG: sortase [Patescibacteria group bacterium]